MGDGEKMAIEVNKFHLMDPGTRKQSNPLKEKGKVAGREWRKRVYSILVEGHLHRIWVQFWMETTVQGRCNFCSVEFGRW